MIVVGIDPGTACGWSVFRDGAREASGTWDLSASRYSGGGMRYLRFRKEFVGLLDAYPHESIVVGFEEVRRHLGVDAAHVYGGIVAMLTSVCEERGVAYQGVPVGTIKKRATGKGNASKEQMLGAARDWWGVAIETFDEADALWCGTVTMEALSP